MSIFPTLTHASVKREVPSIPCLDTLYDYASFLRGGPIAQSNRENAEPPEIAIIGAGAAGLVAGYELLLAGFKPVIYEATDRAGGRCRTLDMGGGALAELGAMRVPVSHATFWHYADRFKLARSPFPDPGVALTDLYFQEERLEWGARKPLPGLFAKLENDFNTLMTPYVSQIESALRSRDEEVLTKVWQSFLDSRIADSFYGAVWTATSWTTREMEAFGAIGIGSGGFGPMFQIDFISAIRYVVEQFALQQQQLDGGMQAFASAFLKASVDTPSGPTCLAETLRTNCPVASISFDGGPVIHFDKGMDKPCSAVIVAVSSRCVDLMGLTLPSGEGIRLLDRGAAQAIRQLHMTSSSKLFICTESKFWVEDQTLPQCIITDELPRSVYCLDYPDTDKGVVLVSYAWEDDAATLESLSSEACFDRCKRAIKVINPAFARHLVPDGDIVKIDWVGDPWIHGAFQLPQPGQEPMLQDGYFQFQTALNPTSDRGVYLAGDSISWYGGWIEGALQTGINAACAAAKRLRGTVRENSPLTQKADRYFYGGRRPAS
jgi:tryptophan 2-monooxygenase